MIINIFVIMRMWKYSYMSRYYVMRNRKYRQIQLYFLVSLVTAIRY